MLTNWILPIVAAYLVGSIPTAVWVSRLVFRQDIREHGSGNAGSTNTYRVLGFWPGFVVQIVDLLKGVVAALLPQWLGFSPELAWGMDRTPVHSVYLPLLCGLAAIAGHIYPVFADFRGGKGMNTLLGMTIALFPMMAMVSVGTFLVVFLTFRMVSLASILSTWVLPVYLLFVFLKRPPVEGWLLGISIAVPLLVLYTHRTNVQRIWAGTESKVRLFGRRATA